MKTNFFFSIGFDVLSFFSLFFFLISTPHVTAPLGLFFMLSVFNEITFIGTGFGIAIIAFALSLFSKKMCVKAYLRLAYCIAAIMCIGAIMLDKIEMFTVPATLITAVLFVILNIPMAIKWALEIFRQHNKQQLYNVA